MAFVNFATREITAKIVYYGPGLGGKTTSLQYIHNSVAPENRGKMISLATEEDRTIYFDFLPLNLGKIQDFAVRVQLYTVPGQVRYNATRKLVLRGADGVVFVTDSQKHKKLANLESFNNMEDNLRELGKELREIPHILQFNKIDLPGIMAVEELNQLVNKYNVPFFETCATSGIGVLDALKSITKLVFNDLSKKALLQKRSKISTAPPAPQYQVGYAAEKPQALHIAASQATPPPSSSRQQEYFAPKPEYSHEVLREDFVDKVEEPYSPPVNYSELELEDEELTPDDYTEVEAEPVDDDEQEQNIQVVEPIDEYDEAPAQMSPVKAHPQPEPPRAAPVLPKTAFSYATLMSDPYSEILGLFEQHVARKEYPLGLKMAGHLYARLLEELYPSDLQLESESGKLHSLNMSFKRLLHFKRILNSREPSENDMLFVHHFLCDLYLSLKEF